MNNQIRTYSELMSFDTFEDRYDYLRLNDRVGFDTFGFNRIFNQRFYRSNEWKQIRNHIIVRDGACDLAIPGREIQKYIYIHHMNPIKMDDISKSSDFLLDPEYLICCTRITHNAIHYGNKDSLQLDFKERCQGDTCPWR